MHYEWQRPTDDELASGILAWLVQVNSMYPDVQPCPYRAINLERRLKRGGDMPPFITVNTPEAEHVAIVPRIDDATFHKFSKLAG